MADGKEENKTCSPQMLQFGSGTEASNYQIMNFANGKAD
jgi:hypothetical protein